MLCAYNDKTVSICEIIVANTYFNIFNKPYF